MTLGQYCNGDGEKGKRTEKGAKEIGMAWEGTPWKLGFLCLQVVSVTLRYVARFLLDRKVPAVMIIVLNRQQSQVLGAA